MDAKKGKPGMENSLKKLDNLGKKYFRLSECAVHVNLWGYRNSRVYENKPVGAGGLPPFPLYLFPFLPQCFHGN